MYYSSVTPVKKRNFTSKEKTNLGQAAWFFFSYFMSDGHNFYEAQYLSKWYHNEFKQHVTCYSAIQSSM